jgi:uncharacterized protein YgbK (DUF1537 family)
MEAVEQSLGALAWLRAQGCRQFVFKYCSTFDSTPQGNIGPVIDALANALGAEHVVVCPAYPSLKRSIYAGHLFVGDRLLSESGMEHHPLTPMTDPDLRRWLGRQSRHEIGHIGADVVLKGREAIREALASGPRLVVVDCVRDADLVEIGWAAADEPLLTGGSGIAVGLPAIYRARGLVSASTVGWTPAQGPAAALAGSCSNATQSQVAHHRGPKLEILAERVVDGSQTAEDAADWAMAQSGVPLVYSSASSEAVRAARDRFGRQRIADALEHFLSETAVLLSSRGVTRLVVAGGETSGAVVSALRVEAMAIGPEIDPGVPALRAIGSNLALALKSGNFGGDDFFDRAAAALGTL